MTYLMLYSLSLCVFPITRSSLRVSAIVNIRLITTRQQSECRNKLACFLSVLLLSLLRNMVSLQIPAHIHTFLAVLLVFVWKPYFRGAHFACRLSRVLRHPAGLFIAGLLLRSTCCLQARAHIQASQWLVYGSGTSVKHALLAGSVRPGARPTPASSSGWLVPAWTYSGCMWGCGFGSGQNIKTSATNVLPFLLRDVSRARIRTS